MFKDVGKKKLGNASSINVFRAGSENYPLCKAVVDHDHQGIMASRWGEIGDEVNRELLEWEGRRRGDGRQGRTCGMMVHLVLLAHGTARDKGIDKEGQTRPPEVTFDDGLGAKMPCMSRGGGFVQRANEGVVSCQWYIYSSFKVEAAVLKGPISEGRTREQRGAILHGLDCFQNKGVRRGRGFDMVCEGEVKSLDNHWIQDNGNINIVISSVDEVFSRKGISRCHPCPRCDLPADIEVL